LKGYLRTDLTRIPWIGFLPSLRVFGDDANAIADRPHYIARAIPAARIEIKKDGS
jgi:hypothetical protein